MNGRITRYTNPIILDGEILCKEDKFPRVDEHNHTYYRYHCPYCGRYSDHWSVLQWPMRRIKHTRGCEWYWAWLHRKSTKENGL